ncbi:SusC/RagA family TonB-linked outer membrane protein [Bacteroides stercorirosoris]|jgi:TonB-linked SusC/RagA family outer membrane protein|uniref:SusC/RagA family TonB-linked outer membrane protein n=1 Tax=Bacteroides stercorirosoris TaxID=871324 RepID=UPI0035229990
MQWKKNQSDLQRTVSVRIPFLSVCFLLLWVCMGVVAQTNYKISGTVVAAKDGEPLIGVNVLQKGTTNGVVTDIDGNFTLSVSLPCEISVTYVGYLGQSVKVSSAMVPLKIALEEDSEMLDEVVVVGYGVQKKKLVTGATVQVKGDNIAKLNTVNALGALQSQTPGVNITQSSGMPGEGFKVTIRGLGTTGSASPLYIIDGMPGGDINNLNPADIESLDVLKDAASAAIYGSRAANGVILVTTKQGRIGKPEISYDGYYGVQNVYRMPDVLNAQEFAMIMSEARMMDGLPDYDYASLVPDWEAVKNGTWKGTNWLDESRNKNAPIQNHALNVIGGTEQSVYSIGLAYTNQEGIIGSPAQPKYIRYTARVNSEHTLYRKGKLDIIKVGENLTYSYSERNGIAIGDTWSNDIRNMLHANPFLPNKDENGNFHYAIPWEIREANPIGQMYYANGQNIAKSHALQGNIFLTIQPVTGLKLKSNFGYSFYADNSRSFTPVYKLASNTFSDNNSVTQEMSMGGNIMWENTVTYDFKLNNHSFGVLLGQSIEKHGLGDTIGGSNINSIFDDFKHAYLSNTPTITNRTSLHGYPWGKESLASFFGRVNYDYANKYMATVVLRIDGSSKFARGHRWGYFPSVSVGWAISEEAFMEPTKSWMDFLKIRASWGQNGNQDIDGFQYLSTIAFGGADYTFGPDKTVLTSGGYPDILANPDVTWETSEQLDFGLDARFLNSRLGVNFDYYIKDTKDWLLVAPMLDSFGTGAPFVNGGDVRNQGYEISLNWNDHISDFEYSATLNLAHNKNKVTRIANAEGIIHGDPDVLSNQTTEMYRAQVGYPIGYFYGYSTAGIFQSEEQIANYKGAKLDGTKPGDVIWVDRDHNGVIDDGDQGMIGDPNPDYNLGLSLSASYKGFDISMTMNGAFGNQIMKSYRSYVDYTRQNYTSDIFGRWHGEGTSDRLPRLTSGTHSNWQYVSDLYMEDGDYLRMQNLTIGYDFKKLFKNLPLKQLRLYVAAQNLFTITGYSGMDPEVGYGGYQDWVSGIDLGFYPSPRTYMVGVNIKF